jgi:hypothetical protein
MATQIMTYTIDKIKEVKDCGFDFILSDSTKALIMNLSKLVGSPDYIKTPVFKKKRQQQNNAQDWELLKQFKPTQKVERSDNEQIVQSIKTSMNKITDKNYDAMLEAILNDMSKLEGTDEMNVIQDAIFNTASSNRFYSKVYAKLYCCFIDKYPYFRERIDKELSHYISQFATIQKVNPDEDYELFCEVNKENERRKALTEFFVNLMFENVIETESILASFDKLYGVLMELVNDAEQKHSVVEVSENMFILLNTGKKIFIDIWEDMRSKISVVAKMSVKKNPGLSNKSLFKFMDIMDIK